VDDASPIAVIPGVSPVDWPVVLDENSRDFIGKRVSLVALVPRPRWHKITFKLSDDSKVTSDAGRTLTLECPRGQIGSRNH